MAADQDQREYWNEAGGERWVQYIDRLEHMLKGFSDALLEHLGPEPGERVLDIGCGGGPTSAAIAGAVGETGRVLGVDVSRVILDMARSRFAALENLHFELGDATEHAFEEGAFDAVTSRFGVMFFHDPVAAFSNIRQALHDSGRLCFVCWRALEHNPWMAAPAQAAFDVLPPPEKPDPEAPGPFAFADPERVRGILGQAGFSELEVTAIDLMLDLGELESAVDWLANMGPAADLIRDAVDDKRQEAIHAMREALEHYAEDGRVRCPASTWVVRGKAA